jgi:predicted MFS family arabinose efflux permease
MASFGSARSVTSPPLHRNREFVALWIGQTTSALGTSISGLAYSLLVLAITGSPVQAGLVASVLAATTFIVRIPAGVYADRVDRRKLMLWCDAGRAIALGTVATAVLLDSVTVPHILIVVVIDGALGSLFGPAEAVANRRVVAEDQVQDAVATNETRKQFAGLIGPSVGGALFGLGRALPFLADALSYCVSFVTVLTLKTPLKPQATGTRTPFRAEITEGIRWLWRQQFLRAITIWMSFAGVLFSSMGLISLLIAQEFGATPTEIGLMYTITGIGGLAGAVVAPWLLRHLKAFALIVSYGTVAAVTTYSLVLVESVWILAAVGAVAFFPVPALSALIMSRVAVSVPNELHGKVVSATTQITALFQPFGPVLAGVALQTWGTDTSVIIYATGFLLLGITALVVPAFRKG